MQDDVVIVGGGQAGLSCAARLRERGYQGDVTIVGEEPWPPYQRPPLSKAYLLGQTTSERLQLRSREFYEKAGIALRLGQSVSRIDRTARRVEFPDGDALGYGKLVFATGSRARTLPQSARSGLEGIFTLRSIADADALRQALRKSTSVAIVGGGYIGLEVASVCARMGHKVTVIEMAGRILNRVASAQTAEAVRRLHQRHKVRIVTDAKLCAFLEQDGRVAGISLIDGTEFDADLALVGIGGVANAELAAAAGLVVDGGVVVDEFGRTSDPDIHAVGDCAVFPFAGRPIRLESVQNAIDHGAAVADVLVGQPSKYDPTPWFWSDQYDTKLQTVGLPLDYEEAVSVQPENGDGFACWYFKDGYAVAVDTLNDAKTHMASRRLFSAGVKLSRDEILSPNFDLPQYARANVKSTS